MKWCHFMLRLLLGMACGHLGDGGKTKHAFCMLPHSADGYKEPVVWRCHGQMPLWSYDIETNECVQFKYGGCGGNENSFYEEKDCEKMCKD